jgi:hypothetical protein
VLYISAEENVLAPGVAELHLQPSDDVTVILFDGSEIYVSGDGGVRDSQGREMKAE